MLILTTLLKIAGEVGKLLAYSTANRDKPASASTENPARCLKTYVVSTAVGGKMGTHATILEERGSLTPETAKARTSEQLEHALEVLLDLSISV